MSEFVNSTAHSAELNNSVLGSKCCLLMKLTPKWLPDKNSVKKHNDFNMLLKTYSKERYVESDQTALSNRSFLEIQAV